MPHELHRIFFAQRAVQPPTAHLIYKEDSLLVSSYGSSAPAGTNVAVRARVASFGGDVLTIDHRYLLGGSPAPNTQAFSLPLGFLLGIVCLPVDVPAGQRVQQGQLYLTVGLARGPAAPSSMVHGLLQGYVATDRFLTWPASRPIGFREGPGALRRVDGTQPGAGNEIAEAGQTNQFWRFRSVTFNLTTSATVGAREVSLRVLDAGIRFWQGSSGVTQPANSTRSYVFTREAVRGVGGPSTILHCPIPADLYLDAAATIETATNALDGGDQFDTPRMWIEEWADSL